MLVPFLKLLLGVFLILLPFLLMVHKVRQLLLDFLPLTPWREKLVIVLTSGLCWVILEVIGLHLILDQLIPGQGTIYVHATEAEGGYSAPIESISIEIFPVKFAGDIDFSRVYSGSFNKKSTYPALVLFGWGEHRLYLRAYDRSRPSMLLEEDYISVSPYVRVGFWDKHVYLNLNEG